MILDEIEAEEREISARRRRAHERIDRLRTDAQSQASAPAGASLARLEIRERRLSAERPALHACIDGLNGCPHGRRGESGGRSFRGRRRPARRVDRPGGVDARGAPGGASVACRRSIPLRNDTHGVVNDDRSGYHETITAFFVGAVADALREGADGAALGIRLPREAPLRYWTREVLMSTAARRGWVASDRAPLPFPVPGTAPGRLSP